MPGYRVGKSSSFSFVDVVYCRMIKYLPFNIFVVSCTEYWFILIYQLRPYFPGVICMFPFEMSGSVFFFFSLLISTYQSSTFGFFSLLFIVLLFVHLLLSFMRFHLYFIGIPVFFYPGLLSSFPFASLYSFFHSLLFIHFYCHLVSSVFLHIFSFSPKSLAISFSLP